jgi:hypothetical protein
LRAQGAVFVALVVRRLGEDRFARHAVARVAGQVNGR